MKAIGTLSHSTLFGFSFRMNMDIRMAKKGRELVQNIGVGDVLQQGVEYE
jgi:hypothetical protein